MSGEDNLHASMFMDRNVSGRFRSVSPTRILNVLVDEGALLSSKGAAWCMRHLRLDVTSVHLSIFGNRDSNPR
jgi:hypothetical protein